ncbi:hypothetical protein D3C75_947610 [compost metagenome]
MPRALNEIKASQSAKEQRLAFVKLIDRRLKRILRHYCTKIPPLHQFAVTPRVYNARRINNIVAVIQRDFDCIQRCAGIT